MSRTEQIARIIDPYAFRADALMDSHDRAYQQAALAKAQAIEALPQSPHGELTDAYDALLSAAHAIKPLITAPVTEADREWAKGVCETLPLEGEEGSSHPQPVLANGQPEAGASGVTVASASAFLEEAAKYFERRPTRGEDRAHWSNTTNAANCRKIVNLLTALADADTSARQPSPRVDLNSSSPKPEGGA